MSTVKQIIEKAYTKVNGEYEPVAESSDDFKTYLMFLNMSMETWFDTPYVKWQSLFDMNYKLPTPVATGILSYAVADDDDIVIGNTPFDSVYFVDGTGKIIRKYKMTDQAMFQSSQSKHICMLTGGMLTLKTVEDDMVGTFIKLPVYKKPKTYASGSEEVKIDSTSWLVKHMAASLCDASPVPFIARNADKFYDEAKTSMKTMRSNNVHRQHLAIKGYSQPLPRHFDEVINFLTIRDL